MKLIVGICTYRRDVFLRRLLESLQDTLWPGSVVSSVEVLVVDNDPTPETLALCEELNARLAIPVRYQPEPRAGLVPARNALVDTALEMDADLLAFLDDDDVPAADWLVHLVAEHQRSGADIVAGNRQFPDERPPSSGKENAARSGKLSIKEVGGNRVPKGAATANLLVQAEVLRRLKTTGPAFHPDFSETGGEDEDFFIRVAGIGARFAIAPRSMVTQYHESERFLIRGAYRRGFKTGCARLNVISHHHEATSRAIYSPS